MPSDPLKLAAMVLVSPEKIAAVMALAAVPHSFAELDEMVSKGLPKGALKASIDHICVSAEDRRQLLYRIIPEATYKRRRESLSAEESERAERLARIFATAAYVWRFRRRRAGLPDDTPRDAPGAQPAGCFPHRTWRPPRGRTAVAALLRHRRLMQR
jgi:beta-glucosidase-like glycosyl hydrolase